MIVTLSSKGQLVIPKDVRERLQLEPGDRFQVHVDDQRIVLELMQATLIDRLQGKYAGVDLLSDLETEHQLEIEHDRSIST